MDDEVVGHLSQQATFSYISLLLAGVALIVRYDLSLDQLFQRLVDALEALYLQGKRIEVLYSLVYCLAVGAYSLVAYFTSKDVLHNISERSGFQCNLNLIKE
jgi:predicted Co/Zn/Cd cation transporter (cation efflux family)